MYQKLQFIAYEINTAPLQIGLDEQYVGLVSDYNDIAARIRWTKLVIAQAATKADKSADTLKVFMMPEFYFRGVKGAYEMGTISLLIEGLQNAVSANDWKDWLFIFGTMIGSSMPTNDAEELATSGELHDDVDHGTSINACARREVYNVALIQKGAWASESSVPLAQMTPDQRNLALSGKAFVTMKEYKSPIDFIRIVDLAQADGFAWERVMHLTRTGGASSDSVVTGREERFVDYEGACLFAIDGIQFGLEICLDHANQRLKNAPRTDGLPPVQVQLVPSCGLSLWPSAIVAMTGGYGFNVDGIGQPSSALKQVTAEMSLENPDATLSPTSVTHETIPVPASPDIDVDTLFADGPGDLCIYKPVDVPVAGAALNTEPSESRRRR